MTFREILEKLVEQTPGSLAAAIMASDGIPVDEYTRPGESVDLSALAVEFHGVLEQAAKVSGAVYGGEGTGLEELVLVTSEHQILFRQLDEEFFVILILGRAGMLGKARYLIRITLEELRREL